MMPFLDEEPYFNEIWIYERNKYSIFEGDKK